MRILVIQNLRAGFADAAVYDYVNALGRSGVEVVMRFLSPETPVQALTADADRFHRIVAAGGDGTASAIAYALRNSGTPLVVYPAGTANLLALNLRMPTDPVELARLTLEAPVVTVDLGEIVGPRQDGHAGPDLGFLMIAGAGFDARIMEGAQPLKSTLGAGAYLVAALQNLAPTVARFTLDLDGRTVETEGIAVLLVNFARIQFDLSVTHAADVQDGLFEVVVLRTRNAIGLLPAIWAALLDRLAGDHADRSPSFEIHTAARVRVTADPPMPIQYDGEILGSATPLEARMLPRASSLVAPEATVGENGKLSLGP